MSLAALRRAALMDNVSVVERAARPRRRGRMLAWFSAGIIGGVVLVAFACASVREANTLVPALLLVTLGSIDGLVGFLMCAPVILTTDACPHEVAVVDSVGPYRQLPEPALERVIRVEPREEPVVYGLLVGIGAIPVLLALVGHTAFGVAETIGSLMVVLGIAGFGGIARTAIRRRRSSR
jgi:hypothetical protein